MKNKNKPESEMMGYAYDPHLSEGSAKVPLFQTSTFIFKNAEEGKSHFHIAYGLREKGENESMSLAYSRINNPNLEIAEDRLKLWDRSEGCALFQSGMAAITTTILELTRPNTLILHSSPLYGGTDHFIEEVLPKYNIKSMYFDSMKSLESIIKKKDEKFPDTDVSLVYIESPANPTNTVVDINKSKELADHFSKGKEKVYVAIDNTFMGPVFSQPIDHGADVVLYSATKYIGGHSDLVAGAACGSNEVISRIKTLRVFMGNMASPFTSWLILRSLETLKIRMEKSAENANKIAKELKSHKMVDKVHYLGLVTEDSPEYNIIKKQYSSPGGMISFDIKGGEKEAFMFLDNLKLVKLAVSLGGTESLACHPYSMTHADVNVDTKLKMGMGESLVRLSIGIEDSDDLVNDIINSLDTI
ncbi:MAG: methionine gamma-lyase [Flammeovirgaceae bacterium]|nr:methionine gamma-lyase [Flammeovirgaceae bacterium]|tara:strand:- start:2859 stop:4106 length:1248 start_codon:yes stop_codon:yes gene_type:complete